MRIYKGIKQPIKKKLNKTEGKTENSRIISHYKDTKNLFILGKLLFKNSEFLTPSIKGFMSQMRDNTGIPKSIYIEYKRGGF